MASATITKYIVCAWLNSFLYCIVNFQAFCESFFKHFYIYDPIRNSLVCFHLSFHREDARFTWLCVYMDPGRTKQFPTWQVYMEISGWCLNVLQYYLFPSCISSRTEEIPRDNVCALFRSHCTEPNIVPLEILII